MITVIICFDFLSVSSLFYGFNLSGDNLTSDPFLYLVLIGLVEALAYIFIAPIIDRWGRRTPIVLLFLLSGAVITATTFIPPGDTKYV